MEFPLPFYILHTENYAIFTAMEVDTFATLTMSFTSSIKAGTTFINSTIINCY